MEIEIRKHYQLSLDLTEFEAQVLWDIVASISGEGPVREVANRLHEALFDFLPPDTSRRPFVMGTLTVQEAK